MIWSATIAKKNIHIYQWNIQNATDYQCVTELKMLNDTDTDTLFRYQIFSITIPVLFLVPNFSDTGSETFFRY